VAAALLAVCFVFGLTAYYWRKTSDIDRIQAGDDVYYLGLLYTLISLAVSLYRFNTEGQTDDIISNFGIAISSTICGLAGRILLADTKVRVDEIEARVREDLATAARRLRAEMEYSINEFRDKKTILFLPN